MMQHVDYAKGAPLGAVLSTYGIRRIHGTRRDRRSTRQRRRPAQPKRSRLASIRDSVSACHRVVQARRVRAKKSWATLAIALLLLAGRRAPRFARMAFLCGILPPRVFQV